MLSRRTLEIAGFFTIAAALHVSAAALMLPTQLQKGEAIPAPPASLSAGGAAVQAMVEDWETPPDAQIADQPDEPLAEPEPQPLQTPAEDAPLLAAMPDMTPPEADVARPNLPPPPPQRIDPAELDLPELAQMSPPQIKPDTALAKSERPDRKPRRPEPRKAEPRKAEPKAQPKRQQAQAAPTRAAPAASQQRSGQGGRSQAASQGGGGGGVSAQTRANLQAQWSAQLQRCLGRQISRVSGGRGASAMVTFTVTRGGRIQSSSLTGSSGNARVDQQIMRAVQRTGSCPAAPAGLTNATYRFSLPFRVR